MISQSIKRTSLITWILFSFLTVVMMIAFLGSEAQAKGDSKDCQPMKSLAHDTWIQGKLEGAYLLNKHLNPIEIETGVKDNVVFLSGSVDSEIEKDLAGEIAKSIEGVKDVKNQLTVRPQSFKSQQNKSGGNENHGFVQKVEDASITAAVKFKLIKNSNTDGSDINVDTMNHVVTLKGHVHSAQEKELAEKLAMNTDDVQKVVNQLKIKKE